MSYHNAWCRFGLLAQQVLLGGFCLLFAALWNKSDLTGVGGAGNRDLRWRMWAWGCVIFMVHECSGACGGHFSISQQRKGRGTVAHLVLFASRHLTQLKGGVADFY